MALAWAPEMSIGVGVIDEQHKRLFQELDGLVERLKQRDPSAVSRAFDFLEHYAQEHFGAEEKVIRQWGCPGLERHIAQHRAFDTELAALKACFEREGASEAVALKMHRWLVQWTFSHIRASNQELGRRLRHRALFIAEAA
jgi:hemerythrin